MTTQESGIRIYSGFTVEGEVSHVGRRIDADGTTLQVTGPVAEQVLQVLKTGEPVAGTVMQRLPVVQPK